MAPTTLSVRVGSTTTYPPALGSVKPSSATSGYAPYGSTPTVYPSTGGPFGNIVSGVLTVTGTNSVVQDYIINARVAYGANGQVLNRCDIRGATAVTSGSDVGLVSNDGGFTGCVVQDSVLKPTNPSAWMNGVRSDNITVLRCDISGVCDGIDLYSFASGLNSNTFIYGNYVHDLAGYGPDSIGRVFSHNDCIQITDGLNITVRYNNFQGFLDPSIGQASTNGVNPDYPQMNTNSVMQLTQGTGIVTGLLFDGNWCDGGGATLNLINTGQAARNIGSVTNNKFGRSSYFQGGGAGTDGVYGSGGDNSVTILSQGGLTYTSTAGNTYEDNGHATTNRIS
jgi:hypothetical protein